ncbi:hypothetical protein GYMLUDRAFT_965934 [Collybiopsis luxurians FD-317 M1]|uniref:DNA 3'-5' helicase n=1 Tax=Collybiopsis luxurians FD-317 M1 TaxID=944289 RepID=A0A0D0CC40_9AGAR|nr:hypothetical protein GYMLUDRAFT_965934 [Collybiopsis luxurians FD-317 M1]
MVEITHILHEVVWSFLSDVTREFKAEPNMCPLSRFIIAFAITDDKGTFLPIRQIPVHYTKIQWCFRASACWEIQLRRKNFDDSCFDTYKAIVKPFLIDSEQTPFATMRENIKHFTSVVMRQPGLPRFTWDVNYEVISIDGNPLGWKTIVSSWQECLAMLQSSVDKVFRGCQYDHILDFIDSKLMPDSPDKWFRDSRTNSKVGYSFITDPTNGLQVYRNVLLRHLLHDPSLFAVVNGRVYAKAGRVWEWFGELQDLVNLLWYITSITCPGSARGTEWQHLYYANHPSHQKNFHCLNGMPGIEFIYGKMESQKGHTKAVLRTPAFQISRLLILTFTTVYYAAAHIGLYVRMPKEYADNYLFQMFVRYGKPMLSENYSAFMGTITRTSLGLSLKLRDFRQLDKALLTQKCNLEFDNPEDRELEGDVLHDMHGHTKVVAQHHYGLTATNATKFVPPDVVVSSQRIALAWQWAIGFIHPHFRKKVASSLTSTPTSSPFTREAFEQVVGPLIERVQGVIVNAVDKSTQQIISTVRSVGTSGVHQILRAMSGRSSVPRYPAPPVFVHPNLLQNVVGRLYPEVKHPKWLSVAQAESVASVLENEHVFSVLPTGGGKSLQFFAAPILFPDRLFVTILPLVSLTQDMLRRLEMMPYNGLVWPSTDGNPHESSLIIVPAHEAGTKRFFDYLNLPAILDRLERIFIDEIHHLITDKSFRECFRRLAYLTPLGKKFSFLSATLPPMDMPEILHMLEINEPSLVREIRHYTGRLNHVYSHKRVDGDDLVDEVESYVRSLQVLQQDERGIIYCHNIQMELRPIAERLSFPTYFAGMSDGDKKAAMGDWIDGRTRWIVATTAFGEGIDQPHVRYVVSINPFGLTTKKQEDGRAGRDGERSWCHTIWTMLPEVWKGKEDREGTALLNAYYTTSRCLRFIEEPFDGFSHSCAALSADLCQNCVSFRDKYPTWYQGPSTTRPDIPLALPPANITYDSMDIDRVPLTVELAAAPIREKFLESNAELELLKRILDRIQELGCVKFQDFYQNIRVRKMPPTWSSSYCYLCWVPFRPPCMHRTALPNQRIVESDCPYNGTCARIIPTFISHIWMHGERVDVVAKELGVDRWRTWREFLDWLSVPMDNMTELPNPFKFVNAYYRNCVAI